MNFLKKIVLLAFITALFVTCKKEELPQSTTIGQPVFSFNGTIGGTPISWQAGVNNYYMYSSYKQDTATGVYSFTGNLQNTATTYNSIMISINDSKVSASNVSLSIQHLDSSFSQSLYSYNVGGTIDTTYSITFTPVIYAGSPLSYSYNFGDGNTSTAKSPTHIYTSAGTYTTTLTVQLPVPAVNISISSPITIYRAQPQLWIDSIHTAVGAIAHSYDTVAFKAFVSNGTAPYTYTWYFGGGSTSIVGSNTTCSITHEYSDTASHSIITALKVTDKNYNSETYYYSLWDKVDTADPYGQINYTMTPPMQDIIANTLSLSDVTINYIDGSGISYTSKNALQPKTSSFHINSVSPYQKNLNNDPTMQLNVTFSCLLYPVNNLSLSPVQATNCTAIIAVAYH